MVVENRADSILRIDGGFAEQRGGRIPIHSLLTPSTAESRSRQTSSSHSPASSTSFTALNSTYSQCPGDAPARSPMRATLGSPIQNVIRSNDAVAPPLVAADMQGRTRRAPRPSYSEEQKFFIMYARLVKDQTWPAIEDQFNIIFGTRTKGGLTSVYYRVRRDWGLAEVLKSGPDSFRADCKEVERRARNFSAEFLAQIGYLTG
ncbi:hypothetical protein M409DRAFT_26301 [Zasmidium cellare ATCC 36951]|uniref:Uncharacterized protein n=1 Tax=Zasmidium cellare ATCC 36951 TaxID=1080233 RepID=A0A6A6CCT1_ZASCE|nr:uncharacterized protein M409DRAFT_26301 [Zasmidium cellare ATCC 36951]KAF2163256.1 hypothetical protein M409DRAFT_26301 [Zasmidium cellare ATCC 36951]